MQSDKITFKQYREECLKEDISFSPAILPAIYAGITLFSLASKNKSASGVASTILQLLNALGASGVKDEFYELVNDKKLRRAINFGGESGERRAKEILRRHMKGMPPAKQKRMEKAFKKVKNDVLIKAKLDD